MHLLTILLLPADPDHAAVILFSLFLGGLVAVLARCGGAAGMAAAALSYIGDDVGRGQLATVRLVQ
jgi:hypothetical protein